ncbi:MAG: acyl-CoA thioesterase [Candidatus Bathyarchaeota archaeon]|nr:MAG: acyl-CoA thioesterase [Candidatus Bathyarchaeota archaeon]
MAVFKTTYRITWSDTDAAQVVHHSNYFRLFERAEEEFYEHLGLSFNYIIEQGIWLPRIEVFCKYKTPSRFGDVLEISLSVKEVKEKVVKYRFVIKKKGTKDLVAEGYVIAVAADKKIGKAINIPKEIVDKLHAFRNG